MRRWAAIGVSVVWLVALVIALAKADWFCGNPTDNALHANCSSDGGGVLEWSFLVVPVLVGALAGWRWAPAVFVAGVVVGLGAFVPAAGIITAVLLLAVWLSVAAQRGR